jgi:cytoskeletal protein CcmA (bactofilin family)
MLNVSGDSTLYGNIENVNLQLTNSDYSIRFTNQSVSGGINHPEVIPFLYCDISKVISDTDDFDNVSSYDPSTNYYLTTALTDSSKNRFAIHVDYSNNIEFNEYIANDHHFYGNITSNNTFTSNDTIDLSGFAQLRFLEPVTRNVYASLKTLNGDLNITSSTGKKIIINSGTGSGVYTRVNSDNKLAVENTKTTIYTRLDVSGDVSFNSDFRVDGRVDVSGDVSFNSDFKVDGRVDVSGDVSFNSDFRVDGRVDVSGDVSFNSDFRVDGRVDVSGDVSFNSDFKVDGRVDVSGDVSFNSDFRVDGRVDVSGDVSFNSDFSVDGRVDVSGDVSFNSNFSVDGRVDVSGDVSFNSDFSVDGRVDVSGDVSFNSDFRVDGRVDVSGDVSFNSDFRVDGRVDVSGDVSFNSDFKVDGRVDVSGDVSFNSDFRVDGRVDVSGDVSFNSDFRVDGRVDVSGDVSFNSDFRVDGRVDVSGDVSFNSDFSVDGRVDVSGDVSFNSDFKVDGRVDVSGDVSFNSDFRVDGRVDVSGDVSFNSDFRVDGRVDVSGDVSFNSDFRVDGRVDVSGDVSFNSDFRVDGRVDVSGDVSFNSDFKVDGRVDVSGDVSFNSDFMVDGRVDVSGDVSFNSDFRVDGRVDVSGDVSFNSDFRVDGRVDVSGDVSFNSDFRVDGRVDVSGDVSFNSDFRVDGRVDVSGDVSFNSDFRVDGRVDVSGDVSFNSDFRVDGRVDVSGDVSFNSDFRVDGRVDVSGDVSFNSDFRVDGRVDVSGDVSFNSDFRVDGRVDVSGDVSFNSDFRVDGRVDVSGDVSFNSDFSVDGRVDVSGDVSFNSDFSVDGRVDVSGDVSFNSDFRVDGRVDVSGDVSFNSDFRVDGRVDVSGDVSFNSDFRVDGRVDVSGDVSFNSDFSVDGRVDVSGDVSFNSDFSVDGRVDVSGDVSFNSDFRVDGRVDVSGDVSFNSDFRVDGRVDVSGDVSLNAKLFVTNDVSFNSDLYVKEKLTVDKDVSFNSNLYIDDHLTVSGDGSFNGSLTVNADGTNYSDNDVLDAKGYITSTGLYIYTEKTTTECAKLWSASNNNVWLASKGNIYFRTSGFYNDAVAGTGMNVLEVKSNNVKVNGDATITGGLSANSLTTDGILGFTSNSTASGSTDRIILQSSSTSSRFAIGISSNTAYLSTYENIDFVLRRTAAIDNSTTPKLRFKLNGTNPQIHSSVTNGNIEFFRNANGTPTKYFTLSSNSSNDTVMTSVGSFTLNTDTDITGNLSITGTELGLTNGHKIYARFGSTYIGSEPDDSTITDTNTFSFGTECLKSLTNKDKDGNHYYNSSNNVVNRARANVAIGNAVMRNATIAFTSTAVGYDALKGPQNLYENNTAIGHLAGGSIITQDPIKANTFLGALTGFDNSNNAYNFSTAVGYGARIDASNQIVLGTSTEHVRIPGDVQIGKMLKMTKANEDEDIIRLYNGGVSPKYAIGVNADGGNGVLYFTTQNMIDFVARTPVNTDENTTYKLRFDINDTNPTISSSTGTTEFAGTLNASTSLTTPTIYIGSTGLTGIIRRNTNGMLFESGVTIDNNNNVSANSYNATSDYRIKENIQTISSDQFTVDELRPVSYTLKSNQKPALGFIAHEVQEHVPSAVSGEKDGKSMQSVDYNQIIPILVKEIQELKKRVAYLEQNQK